MEPIKNIYYPQSYKTKKLISLFFIVILLWMTIPIFLNAESWDKIAIIFLLYALGMLFVLYLYLLITKPALAFSRDSIYFFRHRILFDEIEKITVSKTQRLILFTLKRKNSKTNRINNAQIFVDYNNMLSLSRDEYLWLAQNKNPNNILLYNIFGFDTPLEELLNYFPKEIPIIYEEDR